MVSEMGWNKSCLKCKDRLQKFNEDKKITRPNRRFGRLIIIKELDEYLGKIRSENRLYFCRCDCGNVCKKTSASIRRGAASCGCWKSEKLSQVRYKHSSRLEFDGQNKTYAEWEEVSGVAARTIRDRFLRLQWSAEDSIFKFPKQSEIISLCKNNHDQNIYGTIIKTSGRRRCRECLRLRAIEYRKTQKYIEYKKSKVKK